MQFGPMRRIPASRTICTISRSRVAPSLPISKTGGDHDHPPHSLFCALAGDVEDETRWHHHDGEIDRVRNVLHRVVGLYRTDRLGIRVHRVHGSRERPRRRLRNRRPPIDISSQKRRLRRRSGVEDRQQRRRHLRAALANSGKTGDLVGDLHRKVDGIDTLLEGAPHAIPGGAKHAHHRVVVAEYECPKRSYSVMARWLVRCTRRWVPMPRPWWGLRPRTQPRPRSDYPASGHTGPRRRSFGRPTPRRPSGPDSRPS